MLILVRTRWNFQTIQSTTISQQWNNTAKKEMENKTHRMSSGEGGEPMVRPRDNTAATVAGKLTPVKAADASLDHDRDSWDIGLSQSTCRRRALSRLPSPRKSVISHIRVLIDRSTWSFIRFPERNSIVIYAYQKIYNSQWTKINLKRLSDIKMAEFTLDRKCHPECPEPLAKVFAKVRDMWEKLNHEWNLSRSKLSLRIYW